MPKSNITIVLVAILSLIIGVVFTSYFLPSKQQTAKALHYEELLSQNPKLANYTKATDCIAGLGVVYSYPQAAEKGKPRLNIITFNGRVIGMLSVWPARDEWFPYADQSKGFPITSGGLLAYTQKVFFEAPPTAQDCASLN